MSGVTRPRGPLPARVYWARRLVLLVLVFSVVFGAARLVGSGVGRNGPSATPVGADATSSAPPVDTSPVTPSTSTGTGTATGSGGRAGTPTGGASMQPTGSASPTDLATPSGTCEDRDIVAVPSVATPAYAARQVIVNVSLTTKELPACTWVVSPDSLVVKVTRDVEGAGSSPGVGGDRFWTTQDCRGAVFKQSVVVRRDYPTTVAVPWNGLRSDADCSRSTSWSEPGRYHVLAAAYGADPTEVGFRLVLADRRTITRSPRPERTPRGR
jgi:hypothetical protein